MTLKNWLKYSALSLTMAALTACNSSVDSAQNQAAANSAAASATLGSFGIAIDNIDVSVKPGDNFFKYVNGLWLERTEIPADKSNYGSFNVLADQAELRVREIIEAAARTSAPRGGAEQKIGDLYAAFMDTETIENKGLRPVKPDLNAIRALTTHNEISSALGDPAKNLTAPFGYYIYIDGKQPDTYITQMVQTGLGMPDRDYYLNQEDSDKALRAAYLTYVTTIMSAIDAPEPEASAARIIAFETDIAKVQWDRTKRRDKDLSYNKMSLTEFKAYAPGVDWNAMLSASGLSDIDALILRQDDAIKNSAAIFANTPIETLQDYMAFHFINDMSAYLPAQIDEASFAFYGTALRGTETQRDRWKRGVSTVSNYLGETIGQVYVEKHFPPNSKTQMIDLVENLRTAFKGGIEDLEWMSESTKVQAQDKLAKFNPKIGYPDVWKDYSSISIDRGDLIASVRSGMMWEFEDNFSKLGQPIDRDEWGMTPQTVNAYYNSALNEIVFPAAILDAPFFDPNADPAVNYGGIGAVIGHEMGHGFDDQGRKTDGNGELRDWWTAEDASAFKARADILIDQFNQFEALPDTFVNGEMTLGENIGDLTGLTMAYKAYHNSLGGKPAPVIDGLTGDQRFFLSFGQVWQRKFREAALRDRIKTDVHSPGEFRANGIVRNFGPWYDAFDIQPEDALYLPPEKRVQIW